MKILTKQSDDSSLSGVFASVDVLAEYLGMSRGATYAALKRKEIPHIRISRRLIIPKQAIEAWLRSAGRGAA